jgi:lysophospholipid acyltransferase (LPLAT)-like uncharacterized protein
MSTIVERIAGKGLAVYAELLSKTCQVVIDGFEGITDILEGSAPIIFSSWHGQTHMLLPAFRNHLDFSRMAMIVVEDQREAVLSSFGDAIGAQLFPMIRSDTTLAGARRMIALMQALKAGKFAYITPDGPDGPYKVSKEGVVFLAARLGAWLIPLGAYCRPCYRIRRWDRYTLPLPYSRIRVVVGQPMRVSRDDERQQILSELSQRMDAAMADAEWE